ncbi:MULTISPECIES: sulfate/molybdate ABC transporter ATP-binding protein [Marinobacter]|uniref:sulfate/molybdate ABC transporter ATP-binding protein n=1 Tax=Marinobacter TaxID=2742 RepID=UPI002231A486|nr:TOBE-like domain-containing protein [Marinobacter sp. AN1]UZD67482.1 TOBE-like domain-containing protein [Marinobacter sp. AN1]
MSIKIEHLNKTFGSFQALRDISLDIPDGKLTALLGPSGSGKTTLLRIIAGLENASDGRILFGDRDISQLPVKQRNVGFVFQHYALFRHMTVAQNVAFGLESLPRNQRPPRTEIRKTVNRLLEMIQLPELANRYPAQLSGGQKQRVALARALATRPDILLLDEPFGALDARVRKDLRRWLRGLHDEFHFTSVFVTHDQEEALELSDQVVVMSQGQVEQVDSPTRLYANPTSRFVFDFLGHVNIISGTVSDGWLQQGNARVSLPGVSTSGNAQLYLRPHEVHLSVEPDSRACLPFTIEAINLIGAEVRVELRPDGWDCDDIWEVGVSHSEFSRWQPQRGDRCFVSPEIGHLFRNGDNRPQPVTWP